MPPIRKYHGPRRPGERSAKVPKRRYGKNKGKVIQYRQKNARYNKASNNILRISTLRPKQIFLTAVAKQTFIFSSTGYGNNGILIKLNLSNPIPPDSEGTGKIAFVQDQAGDTNSTFQELNAKKNLADELNEYFSDYRKPVVTSSSAKVSVRIKPNQMYQQILTNQPASSGVVAANDPRSTLAAHQSTLDGDVYVWSCKADPGNTFWNACPSYQDAVTNIPGLQMRRIVAQQGAKPPGCKLVNKYSPRADRGIKDLRDNIDNFTFGVGDGPEGETKKGTTVMKGKHMCVGIMNNLPQVQNSKTLPLMVVETMVTYRLLFTDRINNTDNEPLVHRADEL